MVSVKMAPPNRAGNGQRDDRDQRNQRIAERVAEQHQAFLLAFGARGANVVLAQRLEQTRAQEATPLRHLQQRQHDHRQDQVPQPVEKIVLVTDRVHAADRKQLQLQSKELEHDQPEPERRDRDAEERKSGKEVVEQRILTDGGERADHDRDQQRKDKAVRHQHDRVRQARTDDRVDRIDRARWSTIRPDRRAGRS